MSLPVEVYRGAGSHKGDDIVDPILSSVVGALARGRNEMDAHAHRRTRVTLQILHRVGLRPGQLIQCSDVVGGWWKGMIVGVSHNLSSGKALTQLTIDKVEV